MLWTRRCLSSHLLFLLCRSPTLCHSFVTQQSSRSQTRPVSVEIPLAIQKHHTFSLQAQQKQITTQNNREIMSANNKDVYAALSKSLLEEVVDATNEPSLERTIDILSTLQEEATKQKKKKNQPIITIAILESSKIGKVLTKTIKCCKRHKRTSTNKEQWDDAITIAESLLVSYKQAAEQEAKEQKQKKKEAKSTSSEDSSSQLAVVGLPTSASAYKTRLTVQKKEMYKDPPVLPPATIIIEDKWVVNKPKRNKTTGELTFTCGNDTSIAKALQDFHPNRTPEEVLRAGSFGGTYFRTITSAVTNIRYNPTNVLKDTVEKEWISGLDNKSMLTASKYNVSINKYGVKCGGSLGMWESSGWIADSDPYGWFQWYCRFYRGRRCSDDARQIGRWCKSAGVKGRFRSQICNKILNAGTTADDASISPVIRQTLLHWGLEITEDVLEKHRRRR